MIELIGIDGVAIGFDFFEFIYRGWTEEDRAAFHQEIPQCSFHPGSNESRSRVKSFRKLIERGFNDEEMEKILFGNAMRIFEQLL